MMPPRQLGQLNKEGAHVENTRSKTVWTPRASVVLGLLAAVLISARAP